MGSVSHRPYLNIERSKLDTQVNLKCFTLFRYIELKVFMPCPHFRTSLQQGLVVFTLMVSQTDILIVVV